MNTKFHSQWLRLAAGLILLLAALAPVSPAYADSCIVTTDADSGAGSLREKIADPACDTITFNGDYTILLASQLTIDRNMTIDGAGHNVTLSGNHAVRVINVESSVMFNLNNLTVANGNASEDFYGGGIYSLGTLNVMNITFSNNSATWDGGGIYVYSGTVTVTGSDFYGNYAEMGAGIHSSGTLNVTNSTFSDNRAQFGGGGISNNGTLSVINSTFSGNYVMFGSGGGIASRGGAVVLTNNTFSDNSAMNGGGIYYSASTLTLTNSTFAGNSGSSISNRGGTATITNTIVANSIGDNCSNDNSTLIASNNLADDESCGSGFVNSPSILLGPLADNGGLTQTMALLPGSAAIDAGDDVACPETDQREVARPLGAHCDIGAYEAEPTTGDTTPPTITLTTPAEDAVYLLGQTVNAEYVCQDEASGSGLASCVGDIPNGSPIDTGSIGAKTFAVNAADNADNTASVTHTFHVIYNFIGFTSPVDNPSVMNISKAGQTIPLKWRITDADGNPVTDLTNVTVTAASLDCPSAPTTDAIEEYVTSSSGLQNLGDGYYQWNWKSPSTYANFCKTLKLDLGEGAGFEHLALFQFRK